jgi:DNA polymerase III beta subunit, central domain
MTTIKISGTDFIGALRNVALFSCTDDTLPTLTGVTLDYSADGVTLAATDRYMLARQDVAAEVTTDEPGIIVLDKATVKQLAGVKPGQYDAPTLITVADDGAFTIALPAGLTLNCTVDPSFPKSFPWRAMWDKFTAGLNGQSDDGATAPAMVRWNAKLLARFAKIKGAEREPIMTVTNHGSETHALITCGDVSVISMSIRIAR